MHTNRLAAEKSPYLLQHAHNPVDWYAWGSEAFRKAESEDKPIFLSIGYSTCHWCHVMERESFENESIATLLNSQFVSIKVDREERPDVDRIYMTFVQATTGSGGWPMSVWLTPDLKPFFGGTYFPPDSRWGRPGFRQVLEQLATAWRDRRSEIAESSDDVLNQLRTMVNTTSPGRADKALAESGFLQFRRSFDSRLGGFGGAPKFPRPATINFLLRYAVAGGNEEARDMALTTLREMAKGGMYDQIGGGFHRYSVDAQWFVPHFEKMLYDQAQLAVSYVEAFQITADPVFANTARGILDYVLRDMLDSQGGFYSAEDADSVIDPARPDEKGEGAFYIWSKDEIDQVLGEADAEWFCWRYGVEANGNVFEDPHGEFTGRNILAQKFSLEEAARRFAVEPAEMDRRLAEAAAKLLAHRSVYHVRPHLDDKVLAGWNGLMISAFAKAAGVLNEPRYLEAADRAAGFVLTHMYDQGTLYRRWRQGEAAVPGFLDDYAFLTQALLDLYEAGLVDTHVQNAIALTRRMREIFEDQENGGFYSTATGDSSLVLRVKEDYDGAEPSGNSIAILNLLRLARITGDADFEAAGQRALDSFSQRIAAGPFGLPQMLVALLYHLSPPRQLVLSGERSTLKPLLDEFRSKFLPFHILLWANDDSLNPELANMPALNERGTAYVCENFTCQLPVTETEQLAALLQ